MSTIDDYSDIRSTAPGDGPHPLPPITALIYDEGSSVNVRVRAIVQHLQARGKDLAGFVQIARDRPDRTRCDMVLEELASGEHVLISEDRGPHARGCMLDVNELLRAEGLAKHALAHRPDLLIINKFGKTEAEGGGFRPLISEAVTLAIPVLIAVPSRNLDAWRAFAAGLSMDWPIDALGESAAAMCEQLGLLMPADRGESASECTTQARSS